MRYHVTYYYLATGMEGRADREDYGIVEASSPGEACDNVALRLHPHDQQTREWVRGCLSAKRA